MKRIEISPKDAAAIIEAAAKIETRNNWSLNNGRAVGFSRGLADPGTYCPDGFTPDPDDAGWVKVGYAANCNNGGSWFARREDLDSIHPQLAAWCSHHDASTNRRTTVSTGERPCLLCLCGASTTQPTAGGLRRGLPCGRTNSRRCYSWPRSQL